MPSISAIALFCDDIREEKSGAYSLIGVVGDNLDVPSFPGALAKFAIYIRMHFPVSFRPSDVEVFLNYPNGERQRVNTIERAVVEESLTNAREQKNEIAGVYSQLIASPFTVAEAGRIWVELAYDGESIRAGGINFRLRDSAIGETPSNP